MSKDKEKQLLQFLQKLQAEHEKKIVGTSSEYDWKGVGLKSFIAYMEKDLKPITVRSAKNKGLRLQHEVCEQISLASGIPYVRGSDDSLIQSRPGGQHGTDIILTGEAGTVFPFSIECKNTQSLSLLPSIEQAKANVKEGEDWMVVYDNEKLKAPVLIMEFETFLKHYFEGKHVDDRTNA